MRYCSPDRPQSVVVSHHGRRVAVASDGRRRYRRTREEGRAVSAGCRVGGRVTRTRHPAGGSLEDAGRVPDRCDCRPYRGCRRPGGPRPRRRSRVVGPGSSPRRRRSRHARVDPGRARSADTLPARGEPSLDLGPPGRWEPREPGEPGRDSPGGGVRPGVPRAGGDPVARRSSRWSSVGHRSGGSRSAPSAHASRGPPR